MKVRELIDVLENLDYDSEVYFKPENSSYVEDFSSMVRKTISVRAFYGDDFNAYVMISNGQIGQV